MTCSNLNSVPFFTGTAKIPPRTAPTEVGGQGEVQALICHRQTLHGVVLSATRLCTSQSLAPDVTSEVIVWCHLQEARVTYLTLILWAPTGQSAHCSVHRPQCLEEVRATEFDARSRILARLTYLQLTLKSVR